MKYRAIIHFPLSALPDHKFLMEIVAMLQFFLNAEASPSTDQRPDGRIEPSCTEDEWRMCVRKYMTRVQKKCKTESDSFFLQSLTGTYR